MDLKVTTVFQRNYDALISDKRFIINVGGTRSSKTYSLAQLVIVYCLTNPKKVVSIVRKSFPSLRATVMRDVIEVLKEYDLYSEKQHNKTENIFTFKNGSQIEFFSVDDEQKIRGRKRNVLWMNEANELTFDEFQQLNFRTTDKVFIDFNPSDLYSFIYDLYSRPETIKIHSTYKDNPFLEKSLVKEIEELIHTDENYYRIYALGENAIPKSTIFTHQRKLEQFPDDSLFDNMCYGLDFGYNHPTALVKAGIIGNKLYVQEVLYESHLTTNDLIEKMKEIGVDKKIYILCDYARPEIIQELKRAGYNARNADKNVKEGIDAVKSMEFYVTNDSHNLIKELHQYKWKTIGDKILDEPVKLHDDACFIGETLITTKRGLVQIKDIIPNEDYVLTSNGYKKVLNKFNNGVKKVSKYGLHFDTFTIYIKSTFNHLIKTEESWEQISKLQSGMTVFLNKPSMEKYINYTLEEGILCNTNTTCITKYGNSTMVKEKVDITYITLMEILGIIELKILKKLKQTNIYQNIQKKELKKILNGLRNLLKRELKHQKNGINQKKVKNGIKNTQENITLDISHMVNQIVKYVLVNLKRKLNHKDFAQTNVNLNSEEIQVQTMLKEIVLNVEIYLLQTNIQKQKLVDVSESEVGYEEVYDLEVEDIHEYFANGLLVHNCDATRYAALYLKKQSKKGLTSSFTTFSI